MQGPGEGHLRPWAPVCGVEVQRVVVVDVPPFGHQHLDVLPVHVGFLPRVSPRFGALAQRSTQTQVNAAASVLCQVAQREREREVIVGGGEGGRRMLTAAQ